MKKKPTDRTILSRFKVHPTISEVAASLGVSKVWMRQQLIRLGALPKSKRKTKLGGYTNEQLLQECAKHHTVEGFARALGVTDSTLRSELTRRGIKASDTLIDPRKYHYSPTRDAIAKVLKEMPKLHAAEIHEQLVAVGINLETGRSGVAACINNERKQSGSQMFYIADWKKLELEPGNSGPVWALGPGVDVPRKRLAPLKQRRRKTQIDYRTRNRAVIRARNRITPIHPFGGLLAMARDSTRQATA